MTRYIAPPPPHPIRKHKPRVSTRVAIQRLRDRGYKCVDSRGKCTVWVRYRERGHWVLGDCVIIEPNFQFRFGAAVDKREVEIEALGLIMGASGDELEQIGWTCMAYDDGEPVGAEVSGRKRRKRKGRKNRSGFRAWLNRITTKMAKNKVAKKLRKGYAKALESPIVDAGINAAAQGLSAVGVPPAVTRMALNQRRYAKAAIMKNGGYSTLIKEATGKGGARAALRKWGQMEAQAGLKSLKHALPGGGLANMGKMFRKQEAGKKQNMGQMFRQAGLKTLQQQMGSRAKKAKNPMQRMIMQAAANQAGRRAGGGGGGSGGGMDLSSIMSMFGGGVSGIDIGAHEGRQGWVPPYVLDQIWAQIEAQAAQEHPESPFALAAGGGEPPIPMYSQELRR